MFNGNAAEAIVNKTNCIPLTNDQGGIWLYGNIIAPSIEVLLLILEHEVRCVRCILDFGGVCNRSWVFRCCFSRVYSLLAKPPTLGYCACDILGKSLAVPIYTMTFEASKNGKFFF